MLNQRKIALAVLFKLHQHAERSGDPLDIDGIIDLFDESNCPPPSRIRFGLEELENRREAIRSHDRYAGGEAVWQISASGMDTVDRALETPASFIARLAKNGDAWLASDEAEAATLRQSTRRAPVTAEVEPINQNSSGSQPVIVNNNFSPVTEQRVDVSHASSAGSSPSNAASWFGAVGTWIAAIVALAALAWTLHAAKVF